jgi:hypothetical protein
MPDASGETLVAAPHPAGAKLSVAASIETVTTYEDIKPLGHLPPALTEQRFDGYYPHIQTALSTMRTAVRKQGE